MSFRAKRVNLISIDMKYIKINPADNVAVALEDLSKGEVVEGVVLSMDIPRGHKIVLEGLKAGEKVIKYGFPIGHVTKDAPAGTMVNHECIKTNLEGLLELGRRLRLKLFAPEKWRKKFCPNPDIHSKVSDAQTVR